MSEKVLRYQSHIKVGMCVTLLGIAMAMVQYKVPTIMLAIMDMFGTDASTASWLMSIFVLMMIPFSLPAGVATQKYGARNVVAFSAILIIAGSVIGAFSSSIILLLVARALEGISLAILTVAAPVLISQSVAPEKNGSALGFWGVWGPLGSTFAALATPTLFATVGFQGLWLSYAVVVAITLVIMLVAVKAPYPSAEGEEGGQNSPAEPTPKLRTIFCPNTILFFIGFVGFNVVVLAVLSYVPTILQNKGMSQTMSGFVSTIPMLLATFSSPFFGSLLDKTGKTKLLLVLTVVVLGPCALGLYTQTGILMWVSAVAMGLVGMGSAGLLIAAFMRVLPDPRLASVGMGVLMTIQGVGQFIGSAVVQMLLGPQLDHLLFAGVVVMAIDLVGAVCLSLTKYR